MNAPLLEAVAEAARQGRPLPEALRLTNLPGAHTVADRLEAGETLPQALAGLVPADLARVLQGSTPPLEVLASLAAAEAWRRAERRRQLSQHLSQPLASLVVVVLLAVALTTYLPPNTGYGTIASPWWALLPAVAALLVATGPWHRRGPGAAWWRSWCQAERWARAGLAVRWRLTEAQAQDLLGQDLAGFGGLLGEPGAADHCALMARWHQQAAERRLAWTARAVAGLILLTGGAVVLASVRIWQP